MSITARQAVTMEQHDVLSRADALVWIDSAPTFGGSLRRRAAYRYACRMGARAIQARAPAKRAFDDALKAAMTDDATYHRAVSIPT